MWNLERLNLFQVHHLEVGLDSELVKWVLDDAEQLWVSGVRSWVDGLNQQGPEQNRSLRNALDCFEASIKASRIDKASATTNSGLSDVTFSRRCLFVAVSLVDSNREQDALSYFETSLSPKTPLSFVEYCWALEKIGKLSKARTVAKKAVETKSFWQSAWQVFMHRCFRTQVPLMMNSF